MTIAKPELLTTGQLAMNVTNIRHMVPKSGEFAATGAALAALGQQVGAEAELRTGSFEDAMLQALDAVNADQTKVSDLETQMIIDPDSVETHDVTIAMAKASLSLNITRTVLDRIVKGWKEIINTR